VERVAYGGAVQDVWQVAGRKWTQGMRAGGTMSAHVVLQVVGTQGRPVPCPSGTTGQVRHLRPYHAGDV
jgi:hypothetical protein